MNSQSSTTVTLSSFETIATFRLLRVSRLQFANRTSPRSLVYGHRLIESDDLDVYDNVDVVETKVHFATLVQAEKRPMVLDRAASEVLREGSTAIMLSDELVDAIHAALREEDQTAQEPSSDDDDEPDEAV